MVAVVLLLVVVVLVAGVLAVLADADVLAHAGDARRVISC